VIVVSNSSPLITLARVDQLDLLRQLFVRVHIPHEVHYEAVIRGAGRAAAREVGTAGWIETHPAADPTALRELKRQNALGKGELATLVLARSFKAGLALMDERMARRLAQARGVPVMGCIGILERGHQKGLLPDLRATYGKLLDCGIDIAPHLLNRSLKAMQLQPL
jgi:predicted nucleic acid-binding protein